VSEVVVPYVLDVDLRDVPAAPVWQPGDPIEVVPEGLAADFSGEVDPNWVDPVRQSSAGAPEYVGTLERAFLAHPFGGLAPPDVVGDVGPNHYISMVNASRFAIWDKLGNPLVPATTLSALWTASGGGSSNCTSGYGDPIVQYDELADRWLMSEFAQSGNHLCVYVSRGADPVTSGWFVYDFSTPSFPDYPKYSVWSDAYYVSTFESPLLGIYALDRVSMLAGAPATYQRFTIPQLTGTSPRVTRILPADHDGVQAPPAGLPNLFVRTVDDTQDNSNPTDRIEVWEYHVDFATPGNSTFANTQNLTPAAFTLLPCTGSPARNCVPQPGTAAMLDALFNRAMRRLAWRVVDGTARMVVTQVVDAGGGIAGKRWWELRSDTSSSPVWSIFQEGTYSPDSVGRFMGSVAMNASGDIALGYTASDATSVLPAIRVTARLDGDPAGVMTMDELTIKDGEGVQTWTQRWGDYSSMNVDPADGQTFWYTNEIIQPNGLWETWVGAFSLDGIFSDGFELGDTTAWTRTKP
ncbi:MAG: hypothetical protein PVG53_13220, partial [Holophagae bacterium]|jgi:hypothetical protein